MILESKKYRDYYTDRPFSEKEKPRARLRKWIDNAETYRRERLARASPDADEPKPRTYEEAKALLEARKQGEPQGPRTYEEAKALEQGAVIDAEFRQIGGDSS